LNRASAYDTIEQRLRLMTGLVARLALSLVDRARRLTVEIGQLTAEITTAITAIAPTLLAIPGCGVLTAAKIVGETAGVTRSRSKDAYARHNGTAPLPVWSSNRA
jgi:transposase